MGPRRESAIGAAKAIFYAGLNSNQLRVIAELREGATLTSQVRAISSKTGVSETTVRRILSFLRARDLIKCGEGSPLLFTDLGKILFTRG